MMNLGYPGGPIIGKLASEYTGKFHGIFPMVILDKDKNDFSFSGLKSAVKREVDKRVTHYQLLVASNQEK
jgi:N6-L-threonylcarbamoyladenine synthase